MEPLVEKAVNELINAEIWSSGLYTDLQIYLERKEMPILASWLNREVQKKTERIHRLMELLLRDGKLLSINELSYSPRQWLNPLSALNVLLDHECYMSKLADDFQLLTQQMEDPSYYILACQLYADQTNFSDGLLELIRMLVKEGRRRLPDECF